MPPKARYRRRDRAMLGVRPGAWSDSSLRDVRRPRRRHREDRSQIRFRWAALARRALRGSVPADAGARSRSYPHPPIRARRRSRSTRSAPLEAAKGRSLSPQCERRRGAGVADRGGLENRCTFAGYRGFESHPLRQPLTAERSPLRPGSQKNTLFQRGLATRLGTTPVDRGAKSSLFSPLSPEPGNYANLIPSS